MDMGGWCHFSTDLFYSKRKELFLAGDLVFNRDINTLYSNKDSRLEEIVFYFSAGNIDKWRINLSPI